MWSVLSADHIKIGWIALPKKYTGLTFNMCETLVLVIFTFSHYEGFNGQNGRPSELFLRKHGRAYEVPSDVRPCVRERSSDGRTDQIFFLARWCSFIHTHTTVWGKTIGTDQHIEESKNVLMYPRFEVIKKSTLRYWFRLQRDTEKKTFCIKIILGKRTRAGQQCGEVSLTHVRLFISEEILQQFYRKLSKHFLKRNGKKGKQVPCHHYFIQKKLSRRHCRHKSSQKWEFQKNSDLAKSFTGLNQSK